MIIIMYSVVVWFGFGKVGAARRLVDQQRDQRALGLSQREATRRAQQQHWLSCCPELPEWQGWIPQVHSSAGTRGQTYPLGTEFVSAGNCKTLGVLVGALDGVRESSPRGCL
jgi:hypothetical protein